MCFLFYNVFITIRIILIFGFPDSRFRDFFAMPQSECVSRQQGFSTGCFILNGHKINFKKLARLVKKIFFLIHIGDALAF